MRNLSMTKKTSIALIIVMVMLPGVWWVYRTTEKNHAYSFLEDAVTAQPFANQLSTPERTETDCYPPGTNQVRCSALDYKLDSELCRYILASSTEGDAKNCKEIAVSFEQTYKDRKVFYSLYPGDKFMTIYAYDE